MLRLCALRKPRSTRPTTAGGSKKRRSEGQGVQLQDTGPQDGVGTAGGVRGSAVNFMSARRGSPCRAGGAYLGGFAEARPARECVRGDAFSRRGERPSRQSTCVALRGALRGAGARVEEGCQTPDVNAALCGSVSGEQAPSPGRANKPFFPGGANKPPGGAMDSKHHVILPIISAAARLAHPRPANTRSSSQSSQPRPRSTRRPDFRS